LIDPFNITKYDRTDAELEEYFLFCGVVAGKTATTQARLLDGFLSTVFGTSPFDKIRRLIRNNTLMEALKESRLGQYGRLFNYMSDAVKLDLRNCNVTDLEKVRGCGPKTARMFLMHSRPKQRLAAIDTHVLKHLASASVKVPKATPPAGPSYRRLEEDFLRLADEANMDVAEYDLMIWTRYAAIARKENV
jgi:thermostable 8-oxoguanine DNA glycosylase